MEYYVNKNAQDNGDHEVHTPGCSYFPSAENLVPLGNFPSCRPAVQRAKDMGYKANGCYYCSNECHTS